MPLSTNNKAIALALASVEKRQTQRRRRGLDGSLLTNLDLRMQGGKLLKRLHESR